MNSILWDDELAVNGCVKISMHTNGGDFFFLQLPITRGKDDDLGRMEEAANIILGDGGKNLSISLSPDPGTLGIFHYHAPRHYH